MICIILISHLRFAFSSEDKGTYLQETDEKRKREEDLERSAHDIPSIVLCLS